MGDLIEEGCEARAGLHIAVGNWERGTWAFLPWAGQC